MDIHHHKLGIQDVIGFVSCLPIQQSNNYHIGRLHKELPITWTDLETSRKRTFKPKREKDNNLIELTSDGASLFG